MKRSAPGFRRRAERTRSCPFAAPAAVLAGALVVACSDDPPSGPSASGGNGAVDGLAGTVLAGDGASTRLNGVVYAIDPDTGSVRRHAIAKPDESDDSRYHNLAKFSVTGAGEDGSLLVTVADCLSDGSGSRWSSCVERIGPDGTVERLFTVPGYIRSATASLDGTLVAALVSPGLVDGPYVLELFGARGETIGSRTISSGSIPDFGLPDWTPDDRLVYALHDPGEASYLVVSAPNSLEPAQGFEVSDDGSRAVGTISVDPDGTRIAYDLHDAEDIENTTSWVLDRESGESTRVAEDDGNAVFGPQWSPDGRHLLVRYAVGEGTAVGPLGTGATSLPFMMVVEWTGDTVRLAPYEGIGQVLVARTHAPDGGFEEPRDDGRWVYGQPFWVR